MKKVLLLFFVILFNLPCFSEENHIVVSENISFRKDSLIKIQLLSDLNGFLAAKENPNIENEFVLKSEFLATSDLLDEMKEVEANVKLKDSLFYRAHLTNLTRMKDSTYVVQISYMGINVGKPILKASFTLHAKMYNERFYFYSPLNQNTSTWKIEKMGNAIIHYKDKLNISQAKKYFNLITKYDSKLNLPPSPTEYYCCDDLQESLKLIGVDFNSDYTGRTYGSTSAFENDTTLIVDGVLTSDFTDFDPHDLWHNRLHKEVSTSVINKPVDEGSAFLYGGSWGLSWDEILQRFKKFAEANPNADWLALYNESKNFDPTAKYPLNVDYAINALLIEKIEKEKGFPYVIQLISCGKYQKDNMNYFTELEKITGITRSKFNENVQKLIALH